MTAPGLATLNVEVSQGILEPLKALLARLPVQMINCGVLQPAVLNALV